MTRTISVITATYRPVAEYLAQAYQSLLEQKLPTGWDWEWIVQEDGTTGDAAAMLPADPRIKPGMGRHGGPGVCRSLALARSVGALVKVLDADDQLTPGTLARDIEALNQPGVGWATSRVLDLLPDGTTVGFDQDPPDGRIPSGTVLDHWRRHDYRASVHPASLCIHRSLLLAAGGWMALPASEDVGLLLAMDALTDGWFTAEPGLLYRKWEGQMTAHPTHLDAAERSARMRLIDERATSMRRTTRFDLPAEPLTA
ncbi:glycosyltransferase family 2 protein [Nocardia cyriacigeorgica]|uniref:glycosyltransferase family 2 protein n=1 Tax=Nocardia cyriacigeorgica TaxID=135487 RepID=UPI0018944872|nr:glycosyltransferase [Nocardia cyriacigeorgica]MBF6438846.1 glycosyltransferase [Nocardia cyriacigeorgica]